MIEQRLVVTIHFQLINMLQFQIKLTQYAAISIAQGINSGINMENLPQVNYEQRDVSMEEFRGR